MTARTQPDVIEEVRERLRAARRVFALTGAGVSAESGVPTFRGGGQTAVWKGMPFYEISSAGMVERDLPEVWAWFDYRLGVLKDLRPNPAHEAIARWQSRFAEFTLATQNIDGLHARAGSRKVLELHGNVWTARCLACGVREDLRELDATVRPPVCRECGGLMRPDVVLFVADFLLDTTRAALNLVRHGVLRRFPRITFILAHGGGFLPYAAHRVASLTPMADTGAVDRARFLDDCAAFYYDTALTASAHSLPSLLAFARPGHVLYGSDWPYAREDNSEYFTAQLDACTDDEQVRASIHRGAAEQLLPRLRR
jgi:Sir2 family/Amidohydrolase